jgi:hypothetical protein
MPDESKPLTLAERVAAVERERDELRLLVDIREKECRHLAKLKDAAEADAEKLLETVQEAITASLNEFKKRAKCRTLENWHKMSAEA